MPYELKMEDAVRPRGHGWREDARESRVGICLHYDASSSDRGSLAWFRDPRAAGVGYHWIVTDDGRVHHLAPYGARVYHAGVCRPSPALMQAGAFYRDANSALFGVSIAATDGDRATPEQLVSVAGVCLWIYQREGWDLSERWRITTHSAEAWPRGRKIDPEGSGLIPVLSPALVRMLVPALPHAA